MGVFQYLESLAFISIINKVLIGIRIETGARIADGMINEIEWMFLKKPMFTNNCW